MTKDEIISETHDCVIRIEGKIKGIREKIETINTEGTVHERTTIKELERTLHKRITRTNIVIGTVTALGVSVGGFITWVLSSIGIHIGNP